MQSTGRSSRRTRSVNRDIPTSTSGNAEREFFVTAEMIDRVIDECPNAEWRLIIALCRYGGLRCPSEIVRLTWADMNWERSRMLVASPKTEHHEGKGSRRVPIFPELRPYLETVWDNTPTGAVYVIENYRSDVKNFRTRFEKIIIRAGLQPWPKLFQNLRSTRQTELEDDFPSHVVCAWLGNSEAVAKKHYLQVTEDHFDRAADPENPKTLQKSRQSRTESTR